MFDSAMWQVRRVVTWWGYGQAEVRAAASPAHAADDDTDKIHASGCSHHHLGAEELHLARKGQHVAARAVAHPQAAHQLLNQHVACSELCMRVCVCVCLWGKGVDVVGGGALR